MNSRAASISSAWKKAIPKSASIFVKVRVAIISCTAAKAVYRRLSFVELFMPSYSEFSL